MIPFTISELCISPEPIPLQVADDLLKYHIVPMMKVRQELNAPVWASQKSGYRPEWLEKKKGRSGTSQHTFKTRYKHGIGAVDWTAEDMEKLLALIIKHTSYQRIAYYEQNAFVHCDYKDTPSGQREFYKSTSDSKWSLVSVVI